MSGQQDTRGTVALPDTFPRGTQALLSVPRGTFPNSGTQKWMTVGGDGRVVFTGLEEGEYVLRVSGRIIPVKVEA